MNRLVPQLTVALAGLVVALAAHAADVALTNAWMRPAPAGAETARVYVDIESSKALDLVGATTPVARGARIVVVRQIDDPASEVIVKSLPVQAGTTTRLAYRGNHLRLTGVLRDIGNGDPVPLTLTFRDARGKQTRATTNVLVRGLLTPQHMPDASRDAAGSPAAPHTPAVPPKAPATMGM
jgi:copper(I)-binding protein